MQRTPSSASTCTVCCSSRKCSKAQPDVNLVSTLMSLRGIIPEKTKETARLVVRKVVDALMKQLEEPMRTAVSGALNRAVRNRRPRHAEIDWNRTIRANLKHWQQEYKTIVPETLIGYGRKSQRVQREIILCIDQSGSMASSVVYSSIFGAVMASMPAVKPISSCSIPPWWT
ncbi:MAG: VWA domain-containing protein [Bilophila wadsworthia]